MELSSPNTTRKVQLLDAEIIAWIKAKYRPRLLFRVFQNIKLEMKSIDSYDVVAAFLWTFNKWHRYRWLLIQNFVNHYLSQGGENQRG